MAIKLLTFFLCSSYFSLLAHASVSSCKSFPAHLGWSKSRRFYDPDGTPVLFTSQQNTHNIGWNI